MNVQEKLIKYELSELLFKNERVTYDEKMSMLLRSG